jgi:hypothetical protein
MDGVVVMIIQLSMFADTIVRFPLFHLRPALSDGLI